MAKPTESLESRMVRQHKISSNLVKGDITLHEAFGVVGS